MKCISILQPWASLVVTKDPATGKAYKQIETRSWNTKFRGPLLIHASAKKPPKNKPEWWYDLFDTIDKTRKGYPGYGWLPYGRIIGMVNVVDTFEIIPANPLNLFFESNEKEWDQELSFGDYSAGRYGWLLSDPILFKTPIPCKGSLSIWNLPAELEEAVQEQIRMASEYSVSLIASPGEGAVVVEGVKECSTCNYNVLDRDLYPCNRCDYRFNKWEPICDQPLTLPAPQRISSWMS